MKQTRIAAKSYVAFRYFSFRPVPSRPVSLRCILFRYASLRFVTFRYVSLRFVSFCVVSCRFVSFRVITFRSLSFITHVYNVLLPYLFTRHISSLDLSIRALHESIQWFLYIILH